MTCTLSVLRVTVSLLLICSGLCTEVRAQFSSPAFDPNVYRPTFGDPAEFDTIYGGQNEQELGRWLTRVNSPDERTAKVVLKGYPKKGEQSLVTVTEDFEIHVPVSKRFNIPLNNYGYRLKHIHNSKQYDLFPNPPGNTIPVVYWADANGEFDSSRYTEFWLTDSVYAEMTKMGPYVAPLMQDSVCDLVFLARTWAPKEEDKKMYLAFYHGGSHLFEKGRIAYPDSIIFFDSAIDPVGYGYSTYEGDYDGSGTIDLVARSSHTDFFYYDNNGNFSLSAFAYALKYDTLAAIRESPRYGEAVNVWPYPAMVMSALDHGTKKSDDLIIGWRPRNEDGSVGSLRDIYIYSGEKFKSRRMKVDHPDFLIPNPRRLDPGLTSGFGSTLVNCGDMTGKGYPVLGVTGVSPGYTECSFYVMGSQLDSLADIYLDPIRGEGADIVAVHADKDKYQDVLIGIPEFRTTKDHERGKDDVGVLALLRGSEKIPMKSSAVATRLKDRSKGFVVRNEPGLSSIVVQINSDLNGGLARLRVRDILGSLIQERSIEHNSAEGTITLSNLSSGWYYLELEINNMIYRDRFVVTAY